MNDFTTGAKDLLHHVRLPGATTERFISQDNSLVHDQRRLRHEEPFALAAKCAVLALVAFARGDVLASECFTHIRRLERIHGLTDRGCATGHGGNEPFAFIVSTKETIKLRLISNLANEKQQMPPVRFALHNVNVERIAEVRGYAEFKELAVSIAADIEGVIRRIYPLTITLAPSRRNLTHVEPGADLGKL